MEGTALIQLSVVFCTFIFVILHSTILVLGFLKQAWLDIK